MIALGRDGFLAKAPPYIGDILWEHLETLQKGKQTFFGCTHYRLSRNIFFLVFFFYKLMRS